MNAYQMLVVILSTTLAIFLVLAIVATVILIQILRNMRNLPEKAEDIMDNLRDVSDAIRDTASPLIMLGDMISKFFPSSGKKRR